MQSIFLDPQFLAGLSMARGTRPDQAWSDAAMQVQQQNDAMRKQAEYEQQQYLNQRAPDIIASLQDKSPLERLSALVSIGIPASQAALILERLGANLPQPSPEITSQINAQPGVSGTPGIPGITSNVDTYQSTPLTTSEVRINSTKLNKLDEDANSAAKELRLLEDSERAFNKFDENSGSWTGAGTVVTKGLGYLPKAAENLVYNQDAQTAKQEIDKLNSQLFQNRVQRLGARGTDAAKKEIIKGLPTTELTPDARKDVLITKKRENFEQIVRAKFFNEWAKTHGKSLNGAEAVFNEFLSNNELLDNNGNIRKETLREAEEIARGSGGVRAQIIPETMDDEIDNLYSMFEDIPLEELYAERNRRRGIR